LIRFELHTFETWLMAVVKWLVLCDTKQNRQPPLSVLASGGTSHLRLPTRRFDSACSWLEWIAIIARYLQQYTYIIFVGEISEARPLSRLIIQPQAATFTLNALV